MGADNEDYIDMEITPSSSTIFSIINSPSSPPPQTMEFEFQMSIPQPTTGQKQYSITSPADELFYKGKLLPLHLPPRLQMVQILSTTTKTAPCTSSNTPMESCNISPSESCRASCDLNPDDFFFEWSSDLNGFFTAGDNNSNNKIIRTKKSWTAKKIRLIKQSSFAQRLKESRSYFKSLFTTRPVPSSSSSSSSSCSVDNEKTISVDSKIIKKNPFLKIGKSAFPISIEAVTTHRKSFSGAIKRPKCLSSSFSSTDSSNSSSSSSISVRSMGFHELQLLKRSCSANSELESSIEGAIAHCKKSQQHFSSMTAVSEDKER